MTWHSYADEWPLLKDVDPDGWEAFKAGIKATNGIKDNPVRFRMKDGKMEGLDGRNRYFACKELRIKVAMKQARVKDEDVTAFIDRWNLHRRHHMTPELRQKLAVKRRELRQSLREIADGLGVHHSTVAADLKKADAAGVGFPTPEPQNHSTNGQSAPETVKGKDGKTYSAIKPQAIGDAYDGPVRCERCTRMKVQAKGCPQCQQAQAAAAMGKQKNGRIIAYDWKPFFAPFGALIRELDKMAKVYGRLNAPEVEELQHELMDWKAKVQKLHATLSGVPAPKV